jgi:hypothetical protein
VVLFGEQKDVERRKLYEVGGNEGKTCFASGENISSCLLLTRMCGVCLEFHSNQFRTEVPLNFFSS